MGIQWHRLYPGYYRKKSAEACNVTRRSLIVPDLHFLQGRKDVVVWNYDQCHAVVNNFVGMGWCDMTEDGAQFKEWIKKSGETGEWLTISAFISETFGLLCTDAGKHVGRLAKIKSNADVIAEDFGTAVRLVNARWPQYLHVALSVKHGSYVWVAQFRLFPNKWHILRVFCCRQRNVGRARNSAALTLKRGGCLKRECNEGRSELSLEGASSLVLTGVVASVARLTVSALGSWRAVSSPLVNGTGVACRTQLNIVTTNLNTPIVGNTLIPADVSMFRFLCLEAKMCLCKET